MNNIEERLWSAARETRSLANRRALRTIPERQPARARGWLVFAAAFAVVVVTFGLIPWLASTSDHRPRAGTTLPTPATTLTTAAVTTTVEPESSCAAADVPAPGPVQELPAPVATTREAIISAASQCDLAAVEELAGDEFVSSFGGGGAENLSRWNEQGEDPASTLLELFAMPHATVEGGRGKIYVWPAAHAYESWDQVSPSEREQLLKIYTEEELEMFAQLGDYLGWRVGIREDGTWLYYVAGD